MITINNQQGRYIGEVNDEGQAHGKGIFKIKKGEAQYGTFLNNRAVGFCKCNPRTNSCAQNTELTTMV